MIPLPFSRPTSLWFEQNFDRPTPVQQQGWPKIAAGQNVLLLAPTGSGKTLAAFLACLDRLFADPRPGQTRILYVSPLKALVYDIERNLRAPLAGLARAYESLGLPLVRPRVSLRSGDTPARERQQQRKDPAEIVVTTPESLYLMLGSQMRQTLDKVETVIVDEIHSLAPSKRGAHLSLSLERLEALVGRPLQRIGLSATVEPVETVARYLVGARPVEVVNTLQPPRLDLQICVPVPDMEKPAERPDTDSILGQMMVEERLRQAGGGGHGMAAEGAGGLWSAIYPKLLELIEAHQSTILFVNSRGLCERLALRLNELAGREIARSHHGSVSHQERRQIEEMLKAGQLPALVATSSLELGIDMGAVDLVILVESPGSVARGLQRVGRAGHGVGQTSVARIFPKFRGDLLESTVIASRMRAGQIEPIRLPENPLDVLAQQIVAMVALEDLQVDQLEAIVCASANFSRLSRELLHEVLDMLSGRYPSHEFADLKPRLNWDRENDRLSTRPGTRTLALVNAGTIPDRGLYGVFLGPGGARVGELDEEMVHEIRAGQNFLLGASTWRVEQITRDKVYVSPAPGEPGRMPFWRGEGPGRPLEIGLAIGAFTRQLAEQSQPEEWLTGQFGLDSLAAGNLATYVQEQRQATGTLPTDRALTVECFRDEIGDWRICILSPLGARVHAPWALALESSLASSLGHPLQMLWSDDGIALRLADCEELPALPDLALDPDEVEDLLIQHLGESALFAGQFRENAGRALLLPRKMPGQRTPLWAQRLRSQNLLAVARNYPSFPIILETYRSCLQDTFDLPALKQVLSDLRARKIRLQPVETRSPSPFARSLVFSYAAAYLYQGDVPLAERRAQALTLDRNLLAELLGQEELRELLDGEVMEELENEFQRLSENRRVRHADDLHDLFRQLGDFTTPEVGLRCQQDPEAWLQQLQASRRILPLRIQNEERWIAAEDAGLYRDALGCVVPAGLPAVFLESVPHALEALLGRYLRTHGPLLVREICQRFGLSPGPVEAALRALEARNQVLHGDFRPGGREREWCDPEFLRRWRRRTLARLRGQVAPVSGPALARHLQVWQRSGTRLSEVIAQLEGLEISFQELEKSILPARLPRYQSRQLDELGQTGAILWVGRGALGNRDGRVVLCRRERAHLLLDPPDSQSLEGAHRAVVEFLERRGASFFVEISNSLRENYSSRVLEEAVEDLIHSGHLSNDSLAPLRSRNSRLGGRWCLVSQVLQGLGQPAATQRLMARAQSLLDRYGLVSREVIQAENLTGGFSSLYPIFSSMEESGKVRRGYFVEGLSAAQFAWPGAVDQLRQEEGGESVLWAASDPANPYGNLLPWPACQGRPRRAVGCKVLLVQGELVLYFDRSLRKVLTFPAAQEEWLLEKACQLLPQLASQAKGRCLRLEEIDGQPATASPLTPKLLELGFRHDYTGLLWMQPVGTRM